MRDLLFFFEVHYIIEVALTCTYNEYKMCNVYINGTWNAYTPEHMAAADDKYNTHIYTCMYFSFLIYKRPASSQHYARARRCSRRDLHSTYGTPQTVDLDGLRCRCRRHRRRSSTWLRAKTAMAKNNAPSSSTAASYLCDKKKSNWAVRA